MEQSIPHNDRKSNLKIFVGGAPAQVEASLVASYFERFGGIIRVDAFKAGSRGGKGCFVMLVADSMTYDSILYRQNHTLCGRQLQCQPYLSGRKLLSENLERNQRRVILKYVSKDIRAQEIKWFLESNFGDIECLFAYKPETSGKTAQYNSRKFRTYSVMFKSKKHAKSLANQGQLIIADWPTIQVEKYNRKSKNQQEKVILHHSNSKIETPKTHKTFDFSRPKSKSAHKHSQPLPLPDSGTTLNEPRTSRSAGEFGRDHLPSEGLCDLLLHIYEASQYKKPGSKGYHWTHGYLIDYLERFKTEPDSEHSSSYRLNIAK